MFSLFNFLTVRFLDYQTTTAENRSLLILLLVVLPVMFFALVMLLMFPVLAMLHRMRTDMNRLSTTAEPGRPRSGMDHRRIDTKS